MDAHIKYGVDIAKGSDVTVLTIKAGLQLHAFYGREAEAILAWHEQEIAKARKNELLSVMNYIAEFGDKDLWEKIVQRRAELSQTLKEHKD